MGTDKEQQKERCGRVAAATSVGSVRRQAHADCVVLPAPPTGAEVPARPQVDDAGSAVGFAGFSPSALAPTRHEHRRWEPRQRLVAKSDWPHNGAGLSGQCTGDPADRPASCGALIAGRRRLDVIGHGLIVRSSTIYVPPPGTHRTARAADSSTAHRTSDTPAAADWPEPSPAIRAETAAAFAA